MRRSPLFVTAPPRFGFAPVCRTVREPLGRRFAHMPPLAPSGGGGRFRVHRPVGPKAARVATVARSGPPACPSGDRSASPTCSTRSIEAGVASGRLAVRVGHALVGPPAGRSRGTVSGPQRVWLDCTPSGSGYAPGRRSAGRFSPPHRRAVSRHPRPIGVEHRRILTEGRRRAVTRQRAGPRCRQRRLLAAARATAR
jgi:hypothetical protein